MGGKSAGSEGCLSCVIVFCRDFVNYGREEFVGKLSLGRHVSQSNSVFAINEGGTLCTPDSPETVKRLSFTGLQSKSLRKVTHYFK